MSNFTNALGLDIGAARIGVARINAIAKIPEPLCVLKNDDNFNSILNRLIKEHDIDLLVVGKPRNLSGNTTDQTNIVADFMQTLDLSIPIEYQDETLSTIVASDMVGKKYPKKMEDALAAGVILQDYVMSLAGPLV